MAIRYFDILLTPIILQQSTTTATDLVVIVFIYTGLIFMAGCKTKEMDVNFFLGSLAVGYAWASKGYSSFFCFGLFIFYGKFLSMLYYLSLKNLVYSY